MYGRISNFAGPLSSFPAPAIVYSAGLFRTTYSGYFADVVSFFATATATATIGKTTNVTGRVFYHPATRGF